MATSRTWYVVHTHSRAEQIAERHLARQGFRPFLPQYLKRRRHARRTDWVRAPLFPGYIFVALNTGAERWRAISSTVGVNRLICRGDEPAPVPGGVVEEIVGRMDTEGVIAMAPEVPFRKGDVVRVNSGAMTDQIGVFDCVTDEERVFLLLDLLGRQVKVKLPLEAVTPYY